MLQKNVRCEADGILKLVVWASDCVFRQFYQKDIITHDSMGENLLKKSKKKKKTMTRLLFCDTVLYSII